MEVVMKAEEFGLVMLESEVMEEDGVEIEVDRLLV